MTAQQLITRALRMIGALKPGRTPNASESATGLEILNGMIEAWNIDRRKIPFLTTYTQLLTAATSYTIGPGAQLDQPRPVRIERASLTDPRRELRLLERIEWIKGITPGVFYDDTWPIGTLYIFPGYSGPLELEAWCELTKFAALDDDVEFPQGYSDAIAYNLAVRLAPEWSRDIRPDVMAMSHSTLARIEGNNSPSPVMSTDRALTTRWRYYINSNRLA